MEKDTAAGAAPASEELSALRAEAAADSKSTQNLETTAPTVESVEEWRDGIKFAVLLASQPYPKLESIYTDEAVEKLARGIHGVAVKRGWSLAAIQLKWREEIALAMVALPLLKQTAAVIKAANDEKAKPAKPQPAVPDATPAAKPKNDDGALRFNS